MFHIRSIIFTVIIIFVSDNLKLRKNYFTAVNHISYLQLDNIRRLDFPIYFWEVNSD